MIELKQVSKRFGATLAVDTLSLVIERGLCTVLLGRSGSGKSTLLRMINRLIEHDSGRILIDAQEIRSFAPEHLRRTMGYAIQSVGLFPHWTVARNVATVPRLLGWTAARISDRVDALLTLLHLPPAQFRARLPHQLSGGQQQRVGVARALAGDPAILLMDEPFGALDPLTRASLQMELARIQRSASKTLVLVTHDVDEALRLGDQIVLLDRGSIVQAGTPALLLAQPANAFVAEFFGVHDRGLRLLGLHRIEPWVRWHIAQADEPTAPRMAPALAHVALTTASSHRDALDAFVVTGAERLPVLDEVGVRRGELLRSDLLQALSVLPSTAQSTAQ